MLLIKPNLFIQQSKSIRRPQLTSITRKSTSQTSTHSGKTIEKPQQQILVLSIALPVPEVEDTNPCQGLSCKMTCHVTCPQLSPRLLACKSWDITIKFILLIFI